MPLFTPFINGVRWSMEISDEDREKITRGLGRKGFVTDMKTGIQYEVFGAPCELPGCYCDATAVAKKEEKK